KKMEEIAKQFNVNVGTTKQDTINADEDMLCHEYALEFAFEGTRFYDLARLARHKNEAGIYGGNFGNLWFARKLSVNNPVKDLSDQHNWYLPFK
ncbi:MAG: RagB/SusD family nutrient uptake outer membrane protein, partial [Prevotella sp.]|nr:RagB/SusD family nutrient uptake outer membrane protein [Prevotella sp.]